MTGSISIGLVALLAVLALVTAWLSALTPPKAPGWVAIVLLALAILIMAVPK